MSLEAGRKLGPYEIVEPIGKGGMGEVYRAHDTKLDRDVAIKVLPEEFANDEERLARFEREAKLLASLNHPNIASIHGFEESDGVKALVLELVEGPTLAERVEKGPIPVDEAIAIAKQIAEALEAGHEAGVIHRDLKPANIKVRDDGTVKVLDYGLAKALEGDAPTGADSELSQSPTLTRQGTQIGVILGTAAYMSPEQAKGKRVDKRTDIWAFGAVAYDMLTGKRAFAANDVSDTLAYVLTKEPDWNALPSATPEFVRQVVQLCLKKDLKQRPRDIGDVLLVLGGAFGVATANPARQRFTRLRAVVAAIGIAFAVVSVLALSGVVRIRQSGVQSGPEQVYRLSLDTPDLMGADAGEGRPFFAISQDGRLFSYIANNALRLRRLDTMETESLDGTEGATNPFFSPDGEWVGFWSQGRIRKVSTQGGSAITVLDVPRQPFGASWGPDGIVFALPLDGIYRVPAEGGISEQLLAFEDGESGWAPSILPGGRALMYTSPAESPARRQTVVRDLASGEQDVLIANGGFAHYAQTGHLVFPVETSLLAAPFDVDELAVTGPAVPVVDVPGGATRPFALSTNGTLVYSSVETRSRLVWIERSGRVEPLPTDEGQFRSPAFSPDGNTVALQRTDRGETDIWLYDLRRAVFSKLTFTGDARLPVWTPDGKELVFCSGTPANMFSMPSDGSGSPTRLTTSDFVQCATSWAPSGETLVYNQGGIGDIDIWTLTWKNESVLNEVFLQTPAYESSPEFSPDGSFVAYDSTESGQWEVYVRSFPDGSNKVQISMNGGGDPRWSPTGAELYFRQGDEAMVVAFEDGAPTQGSNARKVFETPTSAFDVSPSGDSFFVIAPANSRASLVVAINWHKELKRLVPTNN